MNVPLEKIVAARKRTLIGSLEFLYMAAEVVDATNIHLMELFDEEERTDIREALQRHGVPTVPYSVNGEPISVSGWQLLQNKFLKTN